MKNDIREPREAHGSALGHLDLILLRTSERRVRDANHPRLTVSPEVSDDGDDAGSDDMPWAPFEVINEVLEEAAHKVEAPPLIEQRDQDIQLYTSRIQAAVLADQQRKTKLGELFERTWNRRGSSNIDPLDCTSSSGTGKFSATQVDHNDTSRLNQNNLVRSEKPSASLIARLEEAEAALMAELRALPSMRQQILRRPSVLDRHFSGEVTVSILRDHGLRKWFDRLQSLERKAMPERFGIIVMMADTDPPQRPENGSSEDAVSPTSSPLPEVGSSAVDGGGTVSTVDGSNGIDGGNQSSDNSSAPSPSVPQSGSSRRRPGAALEGRVAPQSSPVDSGHRPQPASPGSEQATVLEDLDSGSVPPVPASSPALSNDARDGGPTVDHINRLTVHLDNLRGRTNSAGEIEQSRFNSPASEFSTATTLVGASTRLDRLQWGRVSGNVRWDSPSPASSRTATPILNPALPSDPVTRQQRLAQLPTAPGTPTLPSSGRDSSLPHRNDAYLGRELAISREEAIAEATARYDEAGIPILDREYPTPPNDTRDLTEVEF